MKSIVLLKHISNNYDEKLLGFFYLEKLDEVIEFYNKLPGFSDSNGEYTKKVVIKTDKNVLWLLQIWDVSTERIFIEKVFENRNEVDFFINNTAIPQGCEVTIEDYSVGTKYWADGYEVITQEILPCVDENE